MHVKKDYIAVVDLGSNSFNLILAKNEGIFRPVIKRFNITVQLAKYLGEDNILSAQGISQCCKSLQAIQQFIKPLGNNVEVRANATYTIRSTKNRAELLASIAKVFPHPVNIITGEQEAAKIFKGISLSNPIKEKFLAIDIGGGSTEIIFANNLEPVYLTSQNIGCVSLSQKFFSDGKVLTERFEQAYQYAMQVLAPIKLEAAKYGYLNPKIAFGSSGTVKNSLLLVKTQFKEVEKLLQAYLDDAPNKPNVPNTAIHRKFVANQLQTIAKFKLQTRSRNSLTIANLQMIKQLVLVWSTTHELIEFGYDASGRNVLLGGLAVLLALFDTFEIKAISYSDTALREGVLYQELDHQQLFNLKQLTLSNLQQRYNVDPFVLDAFTANSYALAQQNNLPYTTDQIRCFCLFVLLGLFIEDDAYIKHSQYIFKATQLYGFTHKELVEIERLLNAYANFTNKAITPLTQLAVYMIISYFFISSNFDTLVTNGKIRMNYNNREQLTIYVAPELYEQNAYVKETFARMQSKYLKRKFTLHIETLPT